MDLREVPNENRKAYVDAVTARMAEDGVDMEVQYTKVNDYILFLLKGYPSKDTNLSGLPYFFQSSGCLEFHETFGNEEVITFLVKLNEQLRDTANVSTAVVKNDSVSLEADFLAKGEGNEKKQRELDSVNNANRVFRILIPNVDQSNRLIPGPVIGMARKEDKIKVDSLFNSITAKQVFPSNLQFMWSDKPDPGTGLYSLYAIKASSRDSEWILRGDKIEHAEVQQDEQFSGANSVRFQFNKDGARHWANLTKKNVDKAIAITFDNKVFSAPIVQSEITGGDCQITGNFTEEEVKMMVILLNSPSFPGKPRVTSVTKIKN